MAEARRKFDEDFRQGAVRLVRETGKPIAQVARELGINEGTLELVPGVVEFEVVVPRLTPAFR
jgi:hypothetical protein